MTSRSNPSVLRRAATVGTLVVVSVFFVAACSSKKEPSASEANQELCQAKTELSDTAKAVGALDPATTTVAGLQNLRSNVSDAFDNIDEAAKVVAEAELQDLRKAKDDFLKAVQGVDDQATLQQAAAQVGTAAAALKTALEAVLSKADCS